MTIFKVFKQEKVKKVLHYVMLVAMLHSSVVAPCQEMFIGYLNLKQPLRYTGKYPISTATENPVADLVSDNKVPASRIKNDQSNFLKSADVAGVVKLARINLNADIKNGHIGVTKEQPSDNAKDNIFKFDFNQASLKNAKAYLVYDIKGVESANRSINDRFATGGYLVKYHNEWMQKREIIDFRWLTKGENRVMFSVPKNAVYSYEVRNVRLEIEQTIENNPLPLLVVDNEAVRYAKDNKIYIKGFLPGNNTNDVKVLAGEIALEVNEGEFEGFVTLTDEIKKRGFIVVKAYDSKGLLGQELITADNFIPADDSFAIENKAFEKSAMFNTRSNAKITLEGASLNVKQGALQTEKRISIKKLRTVDVAPLSPGMINVTKGAKAYRFLPDGTKFNTPVELSLEYDEALLPKGYTAKDISTFYFDTHSKSWVAVKRDSIIESTKTIKSSTNHFTDYINGIIQTPESPETSAFTATMMNDIKAADPAAEMTIVSPPQVSQRGDANVSYPIKIPSGRKGMQPNLGIQYSSDGGNGWLGEGWDLSIPAITLDTRWGVPQFDPVNESEIYTLGGEQLMYPKIDGKDWMPNRHFDADSIGGVYSTSPRARIGSAVFTPRRQGGFAKIERLGSTPDNYYWKVTGTDGSISWYGGKTAVVDNAVIKNDAGKIVQWSLYFQEDIHTNNVRYEYEKTLLSNPVDNANLSGGLVYNIKNIYYTGFSGGDGKYKVVFVNEGSPNIVRPDISMSSRLGLKQVTPYRLQYIFVYDNGTLIRGYALNYTTGKFNKSLLSNVQEMNSSGTVFNQNTFTYYDDIALNNNALFGQSQEVKAGDKSPVKYTLGFGSLLDSSLIGSNQSSETGFDFRIGAGIQFGDVSNNDFRDITFGFPFSFSYLNSKGKSSMVDIDGDGLEDIVYRGANGLEYLPHTIDGAGVHGFDVAKPLNNIGQFFTSRGKTTTKLMPFDIAFGGRRKKYVGFKRFQNKNYTETYFTDGNGDGLMDIVKDNKVYFNYLNENAEPSFTTSSDVTPNMLITATAVTNEDPLVNEEEESTIQLSANYDAVKVWVAPYTGHIKITDTVSIETSDPTLKVQYSIEGGFKSDGNYHWRLYTKELSLADNNVAISFDHYDNTVPLGAPQGYENGTIHVSEGQKIFFRVHKNKDPKNCVVRSNPHVTYIPQHNLAPPVSHYVDENGTNYGDSGYTPSFFLSDSDSFDVPGNGTLSIEWPSLAVNQMSDDVTFKIMKAKTVNGVVTRQEIYKKVCNANSNNTVSDGSNILFFNLSSIEINSSNPEENISFYATVDSDSNVKWKDIVWKPKFTFTYASSEQDEEDVQALQPLVKYIVPKYSIYALRAANEENLFGLSGTDKGKFKFRAMTEDDIASVCNYLWETPNTFKTYGFKINDNLDPQYNILTSADNGTFRFVIKRNGEVVGKRTLTVTNGQLSVSSNNAPINFYTGNIYDLSVARTYTVEVYMDGITSHELYERLERSLLRVTVVNPVNGCTERIYGGPESLVYVGYDWSESFPTSHKYNLTVPVVPFVKNLNPALGSLHNNWGQFFYNEAHDPSTSIPSDSIGKLINTSIVNNPGSGYDADFFSGLGIDLSYCQGQPNPEDCILEGLNLPTGSDDFSGYTEEQLENLELALGQNFEMPEICLLPARAVRGQKADNSYIERWNGIFDADYIDSETTLTGGFGLSGFTQFPTEDAGDTEFPPQQETLFTGMYALSKYHRSISKTKTFGVGKFNLSSSDSYNNGRFSEAKDDFIDLNGDRYPDVLRDHYVQFTNMTGGHEAQTGDHNFGPVTDTRSKALGVTFSKGFVISGRESDTDGSAENNTNTSGQAKKGTQSKMKFDVGNPSGRINISANLEGENSGRKFWQDINGDGLSDRVTLQSDGSSTEFKVQFNKGYGSLDDSLPKESFKRLSRNNSVPSMLSGSFGFTPVEILGSSGSTTNPYNFALSINLGLSMSGGTSATMLQDINGDGLTDIIDGSTVRINNGNSFAASTLNLSTNSGAFSFVKDAKSTSVSASGTASVYFPTFHFFELYIKAGVSVGANYNLTISDTDKSLKDFDGDGFLDFVEKVSNGVKYYPSNIKRTNKLMTVTNPLGGSFTVDYQPQKPDYKNPHAKWAMTSLVINDGYNKVNDGKDSYRTEFAYENGEYDRRERNFYGYETVKVKNIELNASNGNPVVYRTSVSKYHNSSYFLNGLLKESYVIKGSDESLIFSKKENFYEIKELKTDNQELYPASNLAFTYDTGGKEGRRSAAVLLMKTKNYLYELNPTPQLTTEETMVYDEKGRIKEYHNNGNINDANDNYVTLITYHAATSLTAKNIISVPESVRVLVNNVEKRKRTTTVDPNNGNILSITAKVNGSEDAVTNMVYYTAGLLQSIEYPQNGASVPQRMKYNYAYDSVHSKYITAISDSFGNTSSATYDSRYDKPLTITDRSGKKTEYAYDSFGRNTTVRGQKEIDAGKPYTIKFEYYPKYSDLTAAGISFSQDFFVPVALTKHYDQIRPTNDIETLSFVDGLGRSIQVKKDIATTSMSHSQTIMVTEELSVSGRAEYDDYGRVAFQHNPNVETKNSINKFIFNDSDSEFKAESQYDELDRVVKSIDPDSNVSTMEYGFGNTFSNQLAIKTRSVTAQNNSQNVIRESYKDTAGRVIATKDEGPAGAIWTKFSYNSIGELLSYTDDQSGTEPHTTTYEYDFAGRKTKLIHPDNGTTTYFYDPAGNLSKLQTANLANDSTISNPDDRFVKYNYDFNRLVQVTYPATASGANISSVSYLYGTSADAVPAKRGRLIKITDGTGTQEFEYGSMGEVTKNTRKIVGPNLPTRYFTTEYNYDSFNRLMSLVYPDGETVSYTYDFGGNLRRMTGMVNGAAYNYIDRIEYDHYEQRTLIKYGNNTETKYSYSPSLRRLDTMIVKTASGNNLLENSYSYDKVGNVTAIENTAGAVSNAYGGAYAFNYTYDKLNRLSVAEGSFTGDIAQQEYGNDYKADFGLWMNYNNTHGIVLKSQFHNKNDDNVTDNTYEGDYDYYPGTHKVKTINSNVGTIDTYTYDLNGNVKLITDGLSNRSYLWDESNRLRVVSDGQTMQHSIYDASGERVLKASSNVTSVYQNGTPVNTGAVNFSGYTSYPSPFIVVDAQALVTKHYYAGSQRIVSRMADDDAAQFEENPCSSCRETGDKEAAGELQRLQMQDLQLRLDKANLGKAGFVKAEPVKSEEAITGKGKDDETASSKDFGGIVLLSPLYYYHPDHLGTATFVTDAYGEAYEFFLNLPFGETMAQQKGTDDFANRYKFTGKELDEETGLYYFGARYYDPKASIWMSVDPLAEKYSSWNPYNYTMQNPINLIDPDGRDVITWLIRDIDNGDKLIGTKGYATKNFISAMTDFAKTSYGRNFLLQFMKKGQTVYGVTAEIDGEFSDKNLNLMDMTFHRATPMEQGSMFVDYDVAWEGKTSYPNSKENMDLNVYFKDNGGYSSINLGETIAHELGLHANKYIKIIESLLGKSKSKIPSQGDDHKALKSGDIKNDSYKIYKGIMDELIKINPKYKDEMQKEQKKDHPE